MAAPAGTTIYFLVVEKPPEKSGGFFIYFNALPAPARKRYDDQLQFFFLQ
jgi:hypothetical protein